MHKRQNCQLCNNVQKLCRWPLFNTDKRTKSSDEDLLDIDADTAMTSSGVTMARLFSIVPTCVVSDISESGITAPSMIVMQFLMSSTFFVNKKATASLNDRHYSFDLLSLGGDEWSRSLTLDQTWRTLLVALTIRWQGYLFHDSLMSLFAFQHAVMYAFLFAYFFILFQQRLSVHRWRFAATASSNSHLALSLPPGLVSVRRGTIIFRMYQEFYNRGPKYETATCQHFVRHKFAFKFVQFLIF